MDEPVIIAIDGPAGVGKSTVAQKVAAQLGITHVDSGATYRAAALVVLEAGIDPRNESAVTQLIRSTQVRLAAGDGESHVLVNGEEVTARLRSSEVTLAASQVSQFPEVRAKMIEIQRTCATGRGVVMEGRDIGTVVFPKAPLKIFLKADAKERARRRQSQDSHEGRSATLEKTADDISRRDQLDSRRKLSPLMPAPDAVQIDSTNLQAEQVVEEIVALARDRKLT